MLPWKAMKERWRKRRRWRWQSRQQSKQTRWNRKQWNHNNNIGIVHCFFLLLMLVLVPLCVRGQLFVCSFCCWFCLLCRIWLERSCDRIPASTYQYTTKHATNRQMSDGFYLHFSLNDIIEINAFAIRKHYTQTIKEKKETRKLM